MWKKVLYFGVAIVLGIFVYFVVWQSNSTNYIINLVQEAVKEEKYENVAKVFGGCFDTNSLMVAESENVVPVIFPATSQTSGSYYVQEEGNENLTEKQFLKYERAYYIYLFKSKFAYSNATSSSGKETNKTAVLFSNGQKSYSYNFIINKDINSEFYKEKPLSPAQLSLNSERNIVQYQSDWSFMFFTLTETMVEDIKTEIGGDITEFKICNNVGDEVYSSACNLNFSDAFFTDVKDLFENYNLYLSEYQAAGDNSGKKTAAENKFNKFYNGDGENQGWLKTVFEPLQEQKGYTFRYSNDYLSPKSLIWQTIGILAMYLVIVAILYILLFHFKQLKRLFSRETYRNDVNPIVVKRDQARERTDRQPKSTPKKSETTKHQEVNVLEEPEKEETREIGEEENIEAESESKKEDEKNEEN